MLPSLSLLPLDSLAKTSGFVRRRPRKLSLEAFLQSILLALYQPSHSLQSWAAQLSALQSELFSKTGSPSPLWQRTGQFSGTLARYRLGQLYAPRLSQGAIPALRPRFASG